MKKTAILVIALGVIGLGANSAMALAHSSSCHTCHVPHNAGDPTALAIPLWNPASFAAPLPLFTTYTSPKFNIANGGVAAGQPDGASRVCLGCHDGGYTMSNQKDVIKPEDLGRSHPVSFVYDSLMASKVTDGSLRNPDVALSQIPGSSRTITADLLDGNKKLQCTSCHDVHMSGNGENHLRWTYAYSPATSNDGSICRVCHQK
ncbi:MAG: hypothetical protein NT031_14845 [Planctomycetota bacterium]|nr:hypothetical protein [Planctomycetota bacterium]